MNAIKERILGAVTVMGNDDAMKLWSFISDNFSDAEADWETIPEVEPDEIDLQMLQEIEEDPDCHEFVNEARVRERGTELEAALA